MEQNSIYTIRYVSQRTGLSPHVIRAWEKRYKAVVPQRSPKNRRLYSEEDVQRLQLLKNATDSGHSISQVAQLGTKKLTNLAQRGGTMLTSRTQENKSRPVKQMVKRAQPMQQSAINDYCKNCLSAVLNLDPDGLERSYDQAAIDLTRLALLKELIVPLFREIGELWQKGSLKIVNEHMATSVTRTFLLNMLRATEITDPAPAIVIATTVGQWHDVGALTVALTAAENGWHPIYYGPNLPAEEIAAGVKQSGARAVAISVTHLLNQHPLIEELRKLRRYIDREVTLFVGGRAVAGYIQILEEIKVRYISDIDQFSGELCSLSTAHGE
ncbi:MAG: MerR family transcriptional regulator [Desulfobacterales bacterium]|jgi:DNA-binding transcriptional MerR regulator/methylmalonyl-CoA mutase cobalamin-binding subunit